MTTHVQPPVDELLDRSAVLKRELVRFARSPRYARRLDAVLAEAADRDSSFDEHAAIRATDYFALQHRLTDGRTVLERFVAQRRPPLTGDERDMLLGWHDVVEGCFEVGGLDGDAVLLHNLVDDLVYRVHTNMGRAATAKLSPGTFTVGRIVPLHPATDAWLVTGNHVLYPESAGWEIAEVAFETITAHPDLLRRNPALYERAWAMQARHRAAFIEQVGADMTVLPPHEAQETMREHYRCLRQRALAAMDAETAERAAKTAPTDLGALPEDLLEADSVALIYDEIEGLEFYRDFGELDALFANPAPARDRSGLARLRSYLDDDSVAPLAIRRLVQRHPEGADPVFRALLRKPAFSWARDGEDLLRRRKKSFFDREPTPSVSVVSQRVAELLRGGQ